MPEVLGVLIENAPLVLNVLLGKVVIPSAPNVHVDVLLELLLVVCMTASTLGIPDSTTEPS